VAESRRVRALLWAAVGSLFVAGVGLVWLHEDATAVSVDTALERWRAIPSAAAPAETVATTTTTVAAGVAPESGAREAATGAPAIAEPAPAPPPAAEPEQGVYVQATQGHEETDALGGARHDYPAETPFSVSANDCGLTFRWQPLEERWDRWDLCRTPAGLEARRFTTFHSFFRRTQQQEFDCTGAILVPTDMTVGRTWDWACTNAGGRAMSHTTIVGVEPIDVGGERVDAVHVRFENTFEGANAGTGTIDWWLHPDTGLPVRMAADMDTDSDSPFGRVRYREQFTSTMTALAPRR
jgi:hypothetical protein